MEVPFNDLVAVLLPRKSETMFTPGANRSRHLPKLEKDARVSVMSLAPTVSALGVLAGETWQASALPLPAAML